jgi:excinuclease ABC subunit C
VSHDLVEEEPLFQYLWEEHGKKVPIHRPQRGEKAQMIRMARSNARWLLGEKKIELEKQKNRRIPRSIKELK